MKSILLHGNKLLSALLAAGIVLTGCGGGGGGGDTGVAGGGSTVNSPLDVKINTYSNEQQNQVATALINFDGTAEGGKTPLTYSWDFGDGTTASTKGATHKFAQGGVYQVMLKVTDADGTTATKTLAWTTSGISVKYVTGAEGGAGRTEGTKTKARFDAPTGVAVAADGTMYVADPLNALIRKVMPDGTTTNFAGAAGMRGFSDGNGSDARLSYPYSIAIGGSGSLYVHDQYRIRKISPAGQVTTLAGNLANAINEVAQVVNGPIATASFGFANGIAADSNDTVFVLEGNSIRKISNGVVSTFVGKATEPGLTNGGPTVARLNGPDAITIDRNNNLYIREGCSGIRKITPDGTVSSLYAGSFAYPGAPVQIGSACGTLSGITVNAANQIFITRYDEILVLDTAAGLTQFAGTNSGERDGNRTTAQLSNLQAIATTPKGELVVTGGSNTVRKIATDGAVSTIAGLADNITGTNLDGVKLNNDSRVAKYRDGFSVATDGSCVQLLRTGTFASVLAGNCNSTGYFDGSGSNARFGNLVGIAVDSQNNIFVTDSEANLIRKIDPLGVVSTYAGVIYAYGSNDGPRTSAKFNRPTYLTMDAADNLWVVDQQGYSLRMISAAGDVTTITNSIECTATGNPLSCASLSDIAADPSGFIYASKNSTFEYKIFKILANGQTSVFYVPSIPRLPGDYSQMDHSRLAVDVRGDVWQVDRGFGTGPTYLRQVKASTGLLGSFTILKSFASRIYVNEPEIEFTRQVDGMAFNPDGSLMMVGGGSAFLATGF